MNSSFMYYYYYYAGVSRSRARKTRDPVVEDSAAPVRRATRSTRRYVRVLTHLSARWCPLHFRPRRLKDRRLLLCSHGIPFYSSSHVRFVPTNHLVKQNIFRRTVQTRKLMVQQSGSSSDSVPISPRGPGVLLDHSKAAPSAWRFLNPGRLDRRVGWLALSFLRHACRSSFSSLIPGQANNDLP